MFIKATRSKTPLKIALSGPSGSGKTYSSLLIAKELGEKICVIDTENNSSHLYADLCEYSVLEFKPPFAPNRYKNAIELAEKEGFDVIIIDSMSHEWEGSGGCLDIHQRLGGRFQDWAKVTPMHREFIDAILHSPKHIIGTMRSKTDYVIEEENGRKAVKKVGMKEVQRENFEYELTLHIQLSMNHLGVAPKDRTGMFSSDIPFDVNETLGTKLKMWSEGTKQ